MTYIILAWVELAHGELNGTILYYLRAFCGQKNAKADIIMTLTNNYFMPLFPVFSVKFTHD